MEPVRFYDHLRGWKYPFPRVAAASKPQAPAKWAIIRTPVQCVESTLGKFWLDVICEYEVQSPKVRVKNLTVVAGNRRRKWWTPISVNASKCPKNWEFWVLSMFVDGAICIGTNLDKEQLAQSTVKWVLHRTSGLTTVFGGQNTAK